MYCNKNTVIINGRYSRLTFICHYYHEHISNIHTVFLSTAFAVHCVLNFELFIMDQLNFIGHKTTPKENNVLGDVTSLSS